MAQGVQNPGLARLPTPPQDQAMFYAFLMELVRALENRNVRVNAALAALSGGFTGTYNDGTNTITVRNGIIVEVV